MNNRFKLQTSMKTKHFRLSRRAHAERGVSLIMVLMMLVVVSLLGVGGAQIGLMSERGARNDRDSQVAWQAAEAALLDAELDMTNFRTTTFDGVNKMAFVANCGQANDASSYGLCVTSSATKPAWLTVDFTVNDTSARSVPFGTFTTRVFAAGGVGLQPARAPRYVIELVPDPLLGTPTEPKYMYRVTAMGFGPRTDIQGVLQMIYRI